MKSWKRHISIVLGFLPIPFLFLQNFIPESIQYLFSAGKNDEAEKELEKFASRSLGKNIDMKKYSVILGKSSETKSKENIFYIFKEPFRKFFIWQKLNILLLKR